MFKRFCLLVTLLVGPVTWLSSASAAIQCRKEVTSDREVRIHIGDRTVTLIGWEHLDGATEETLVNGLASARQAADGGHCDQAVRAAESTATALQRELQNANLVLAKLIQIHERDRLAYIGLEMTPEELADQWALNVKINKVFSSLDTRCGAGLASLAARLRVMMPGPEFEFHRLNPHVAIRSTEDQALKDANARDFEGAEQDTFDYSNPAITADARLAIELIQQNLMDQVEPSLATVQRAVSFEADPGRRVKLERELRFSIARATRIIAGAYRRNVAIAANLIKEAGSGAIPLGFRHLNHLTGEILRQCQQQ